MLCAKYAVVKAPRMIIENVRFTIFADTVTKLDERPWWHSLLKVNGIDVKNPKDVSRLIK